MQYPLHRQPKQLLRTIYMLELLAPSGKRGVYLGTAQGGVTGLQVLPQLGFGTVKTKAVLGISCVGLVIILGIGASSSKSTYRARGFRANCCAIKSLGYRWLAVWLWFWLWPNCRRPPTLYSRCNQR